MDPETLVWMAFALLALMLGGTFVLLFPIARRLGALLDQRLQSRPVQRPTPAEVATLRDAVRELRQEVGSLAERQGFVESLLEADEPHSLRVDAPGKLH